MHQEQIWDDEAAESYDTPGTGAFAAEVLDPMAGRPAEFTDESRSHVSVYRLKG